MKTRFLIAISILLVASLVLAYLFIYSEYEKVPFKSEPTYELSAFFVMHNLISDSVAPLRGRLYATFDKNGNCKVIQKYEDKMIFKHFKIPKQSILQLNKYFINAPISQNTYLNAPPQIYDGPTLRMIYKNGTALKIIDYKATGSEIYTKIFDQIYEMTLSKDFKTFTDTITIKEMRMKMLKNIRHDYLEQSFYHDLIIE
jgi:hypothetical protein